MGDVNLTHKSAGDEIIIEENQSFIEPNKYYLGVSRRYNLLRFLTLALLVLFVMVMILSFGDDITVSNLKYLIRDINISSSSGEAFSGVSYAASPVQRFALYRGDLVYVTSDGVSLYSATGNVGLSLSLSYEKPVIVTSEKYFLIYDLGGYGFTVCNSFSEISRESTEYRIVSADISDSGEYIIVTEGKKYRGIAQLYGSSMTVTTKYSKTDYLTDAAVSEDGDHILLATVMSDGTEFSSKLGFYERGADSEGASVTLHGEMITDVEAIDSGFCATGTGSIHFYDENGNITGEFSYGGNMNKCCAAGEYALMTIPENTLENSNRVIIIDSKGLVLYDKIIKEKLIDIGIAGGGQAFLLTQDRAVRIDAGSGREKSASVSGAPQALLVTGENSVIICSSSGAATVDFSTLADIDG